MNFLIGLIIAYLAYSLYVEKRKAKRQEMLKTHYLRMVLLSTRTRDEYYRLLLRKYLIDDKMYDHLPVKQFNDLWIAISDDVEAWTIGSDYILKKEKIVAPDVTEHMADKTFSNQQNKEFLSLAKMLVGWRNESDSVERIKKAIRYKEHDSFGNVIPERNLKWLREVSK